MLPGGVSSPVRAFRAVGGLPPALVSGSGAYVRDEDGNDYIDFVLAYGPHLLGHNPPQVVEAIRGQLERGLALLDTTAGNPATQKTLWAKIVAAGIEMKSVLVLRIRLHRWRI